VKALRHYHRIGLLVPAEIDRPSGYRYYATEQISTAHIIRRFRDLDMPLDEIAEVVSTDDLEARNRLISSHLDRLEQALSATQSAVRSLRDLLGSSTPASIELRSVAATRAAAITATVDAAEFGSWFRGAFGELDATLAASGVRPAGPAAGLYDTAVFAHGLGTATVFVPVSTPIDDVGRVQLVEIPAMDLAVTVHHGVHDDIDRAYGSLATYVAESAISLDGPIRETYLISFRETDVADRWSTEIGWPIFHPGTPHPT
jgi:DNA-binding transcriptional MerR regulator